MPSHFEQRPYTSPNLAVELTMRDYARKHDPALAAILGHTGERPFVEALLAVLDSKGIDAASKFYRKFKAEPLNAYQETESDVNNLGYQLLSDDRVDEAVALFELNAQLYPASANAWSSLAAAAVTKGDRKRAIECYGRSLDIDPTNESTKRALERLSSR